MQTEESAATFDQMIVYDFRDVLFIAIIGVIALAFAAKLTSTAVYRYIRHRLTRGNPPQAGTYKSPFGWLAVEVFNPKADPWPDDIDAGKAEPDERRVAYSEWCGGSLCYSQNNFHPRVSMTEWQKMVLRYRLVKVK